MTKLFTLLTLLILVSCENLKSNKNEITPVGDTSATLGNTINSKQKICLLPFQVSDSITILKFKKTINHQSSSGDTTICNNWTLTKNEIENILKDAEPISGPDWHHLFNHLPCSITGQLVQNNTPFDFEINAGSWLIITCGDSTVRLGNFKKRNENLFLSTALDAEHEQ